MSARKQSSRTTARFRPRAMCGRWIETKLAEEPNTSLKRWNRRGKSPWERIPLALECVAQLRPAAFARMRHRRRIRKRNPVRLRDTLAEARNGRTAIRSCKAARDQVPPEKRPDAACARPPLPDESGQTVRQLVR